MASLLARLKSRKRDKSKGRATLGDETRLANGQDTGESSEEEESPAVFQPPPQLPALDFSTPTSKGTPRVNGDQSTKRSGHDAANITHVPEHDTNPDSAQQGHSGRSAVIPENVSVWEPEISSSEMLARRLEALSLSPSMSGLTSLAIDTPACIKQREELVQRIAEEVRLRRGGRVVTDEGRRVFSAAGLEDRLEARDTIDVHTRWLPPVIQASPIRTSHLTDRSM